MTCHNNGSDNAVASGLAAHVHVEMESSYIINISLYSYDTSKSVLIPQTNQIDIINAYTIMHQ